MSNLYVYAAIVLLIIGVLIVMTIGIIVFIRKRKAYVLSIEKDYRNPQSGRRTFYALYNSKVKYYELYNHILAWKPERGLANVDLKAFVDNFGRVRCIRSPTGKPGDDMIVPIGLALNGQAAAADAAQKLSDGATEILTKAGLAYKKLQSVKDIAKLTKEELDTLFSPATVDLFKKSFTAEWVMKTMGVPRVEDASVITIPQKNAIASLNTRANEFIIEHASWFESHYQVFIGILSVVIVAVSMVLIFYGASNYFSTLGQSVPGIVSSAVQSSYNSSLHIYGLNLSSYVPK
jgi:hypothetical protein